MTEQVSLRNDNILRIIFAKVPDKDIVWMENNLPRVDVPDLPDPQNAPWDVLLAANLRTYIGIERIDSLNIEQEDLGLRFVFVLADGVDKREVLSLINSYMRTHAVSPDAS